MEIENKSQVRVLPVAARDAKNTIVIGQHVGDAHSTNIDQSDLNMDTVPDQKVAPQMANTQPVPNDAEKPLTERDTPVAINEAKEVADSLVIVYEFKIEGMTCVACSGAIEKGLTYEFKDKGLIEEQGVSVVLLMHKMRVSLYKQKAVLNKIDPAAIANEVEDLGFGAELIGTHEIEPDNQSQASDIEQGSPEKKKPSGPQMKETVFTVNGMTSASCSDKIESHLNSIEGIQSAKVNILIKKVYVNHDLNIIRPRKIIEEIKTLGSFEPELQPENQSIDIRDITKAEVTKYRNKFVLSFSLYVPMLFLIWVVPYVDALKPFMTSVQLFNGIPLYVFIAFCCSTIIQFYMGQTFYVSAYKSLKHKSANMDVLIVIGTSSAWLYGVIRMIMGYSEAERLNVNRYRMQVHGHVHNFETASILITIVIGGKLIESYSKMKTVDQLSNLASLKVTKANLIEETDVKKLTLSLPFREIAVELLELKDFVMVQPGGAVPTDGTVVFGRGCCNESMLTGEALPVQKEIGMKAYGGTILTQGSIIIKVEKTAENATFNQIMKLVENAQNTKAPIQGYADKVSSVFVPVIVLLAVLDWIAWFSIVYSNPSVKKGSPNLSKFQFAFDFGISTLVIACPCALGLATPTAVMVGTGIAAAQGILIKGADVLEKIQKIDTIVFDKTGTLTSGKPEVKDLINCNDKFKILEASEDNCFLYEMIYLTEKSSEHPIAKAICNKIQKNIPSEIDTINEKYNVVTFKNRNGEGVVSTIENKQEKTSHEVLCGNSKLMKHFEVLKPYPELEKNIGYLEEEGKTVVILAVDNIPSTVLSLEETHLSKPEASFVVNYLQKTLGMKVCMITGDNKHSALRVAKHLNIPVEDVTYQAYPETKKEVVEKYQAQGRKVLFVGDGINDSPVLAQSDVGCAINSASEVTVGAAGIVLIKDSLVDVLKSILIAGKTFQRIKINFLFAFLYNTILIPVAMGFFYPIDGFKLDPMFAATAMAMSSISVVASSLLLKTYNPKFDFNAVQVVAAGAANSNTAVEMTGVGASSLQMDTGGKASEGHQDHSQMKLIDHAQMKLNIN